MGKRIERTAAHTAENGTLPLEITLQEARELLRNEREAVVLVDVRGEGELCLGHLRGARFIPPGLIEEEFGRLPVDNSSPVLIYCATGVRSCAAAERLRKIGFPNARSIRGGYNAWLKEGCEIVHDGRFTAEELDRYSRNMLLREIGEEGQEKLKNGSVILVGAGGLASSAALYLAACGVGTIGIIDFDTVDLSNLNRQVVHGTEDVGRLKVESAAQSVRRINPHVRVVTYAERLTPSNALTILNGFDVVMDACDSLETKFLLNDACYFLDKPYVFGGAVGFDGQAAVFRPKKEGPCLRCLFPKPPPRHLAPS
jgi:adenylyltransferase/sulfurtransferase